MKNFWGDRKGTSLIEILVVMLVLLFGIMTVVQMYPTGFKVVKQAESKTIATRLAQQEMERWKNMTANLPDGILPVDASTDPPTVLDTQMPGPPFEGVKDANGNLGNAANIRWVHGETTSIPVASYFDSGSGPQYGSRYALAFSPIQATYDPVLGSVSGIKIRSGDLRRRNGNANRGAPYLRQGEYAIDYGDEGSTDFFLAFPKNTLGHGINYTITYSYWVEESSESVLKSVAAQIVPISSDYDGSWITAPVGGDPNNPPADYIEMDRSSDSCARAFTYRNTADAWSSNDPYEFKVPDYILGVISFNPAGHELYEYTARGVKPLRARVDYLISDLRIIHEDKLVPKPRTSRAGVLESPTKLSLRYILNIGDPTDNPNEPEYVGLIRDNNGNVLVAVPMLAIDLQTGLRVDLNVDAIDFKTGMVYMPETANLVDFTGVNQNVNVSLEGRNIRFFYRADGDWSIQCTKAYSSYTRDYGNTGDPNYCSFKFIPGSNSNNNGNRLVFAKCEYGKSVIVDYNYTDKDGAERKVIGKLCRIDIDGTSLQTFVDLKPPPGATIANNARIVVIGSSFTVRVIWRDGKWWRNVDMDTHLTRN